MGTLLDGASIFAANEAKGIEQERKSGGSVVRSSSIVSKNIMTDAAVEPAAVIAVNNALAQTAVTVMNANVNNNVGTTKAADIIVVNDGNNESVNGGEKADIIFVSGATRTVNAGAGADIILVSGEDHTIMRFWLSIQPIIKMLLRMSMVTPQMDRFIWIDC